MMEKPTYEQYTDEDGYIDGYEFDMAMDQWRSQFPDLYENWCGEPKPQKVEDTEESLTELLSRLLAA
jgi:hypothetical protein